MLLIKTEKELKDEIYLRVFAQVGSRFPNTDTKNQSLCEFVCSICSIYAKEAASSIVKIASIPQDQLLKNIEMHRYPRSFRSSSNTGIIRVNTFPRRFVVVSGDIQYDRAQAARSSIYGFGKGISEKYLGLIASAGAALVGSIAYFALQEVTGPFCSLALSQFITSCTRDLVYDAAIFFANTNNERLSRSQRCILDNVEHFHAAQSFSEEDLISTLSTRCLWSGLKYCDARNNVFECVFLKGKRGELQAQLNDLVDKRILQISESDSPIKYRLASIQLGEDAKSAVNSWLEEHRGVAFLKDEQIAAEATSPELPHSERSEQGDSSDGLSLSVTSEPLSFSSLHNIKSDGNVQISKADFLDYLSKEVAVPSALTNSQYASPHMVRLANVIYQISDRVNDLCVIAEAHHIDASYRDLYYEYYSRKYSDVARYSLRLSLFKKHFRNYDDFLNCDECNLQKNYIGSVVVNLLAGGTIGRCLIHPEYVVDQAAKLCLSNFELTVCGKRLIARSYPYRSQDGETLRCAEVSLLNLTCYYSNEFEEYARVLPTQILRHKEDHTVERPAPSRGMPFPNMSKFLMDFGLQPCEYSRETLSAFVLAGPTKEQQMRRLLYWYMNSGIPLLGNVWNSDDCVESHALGFIGIGVRPYDEEQCLQEAEPLACRMSEEVVLYHAADFPEVYAVMDDSRLPFYFVNGENLSDIPGEELMELIAPLHRGMALDAPGAYECGMEVLKDPSVGLVSWASRHESNGPRWVLSNEIVMDMGLASGRAFRRFRTNADGCTGASDWTSSVRRLYSELVLPHFVWVLTLYEKDAFFKNDPSERKAFAEVLIDATAAAGDPLGRVLLMRYPERIYYQHPWVNPQTPALIPPYFKENNDPNGYNTRFDPYYESVDIVQPFSLCAEECDHNLGRS